MRKIYFLFTMLIIGSSPFAQTSNWDFETWTDGGSYNDLTDWENINQYAIPLGVNYPVEQVSTGAPQGFFATKLTTNLCANCAAILGPGTDTLTGLIRQETSYSGTVPQTATFMYKYEGVGTDVGLFYVEITKWDAVGDSAIVVAAGLDTLSNMNSWSTNIVGIVPGPGSSLTPDSIKVSFLSSAGALAIGNTSPQIGSSLYIDALSLDTQVSIEENKDVLFNTFVNESYLNIDVVDNTGHVELFDLTGKRLFHKRINGQKSIDISSFPSGIYLVKCTTEYGVKTNKVLIK